MAFCPKCKGMMEATQAVCPHCGHDFAPPPGEHRGGPAYSVVADIALLVGTVLAALGCLASLIAMAIALWHQEWLTALVYCPVAFFYQLALLVVFVRAQHI
jgi:hypothetical protein